MDVFGKGTDEPSRPLLSPGVCWICEQSPIQEEYRVIDTRRNTQAGGSMSHLSNRKYICEPCALEMGGAMGMVPAERAAVLETEVRQLAADNVSLASQLETARAQQPRVLTVADVEASLSSVVSETVRAELAKKVPAKKAAPSAE